MKSIPDKKEKVITMSLVESFIAQYKLKFMVKLFFLIIRTISAISHTRHSKSTILR